MGKIYSDKLTDDIEAFMVHYGAFLPREYRESFTKDFIDLIDRSGRESVDSLIERLKDGRDI